MSIATEIQRLQTSKANIKTAIENKGVTVGDGTIDTYASLINQITTSSGSGLPSSITEMQSGSFTVASDTTDGQYVALTMSEAPTNIIVWAENDVQETYTHLLNVYGTNGILGFISGTNNQITVHHSASSATAYGIGFRSTNNGGIIDITKDGFTVRGYTTGQYYFRSATAYHWLAWR